MQHRAPILFDRARLRKRRARAAAHFVAHDFLWAEAALRAEETLSCIKRTFPIMAGFGTHRLQTPTGTQYFIQCDGNPPTALTMGNLSVAADEESLPFAENSLDAVISLLTLQWVNDLPGTLAQIHRMLKPDGLFFAILPGGETLQELRQVFAAVESRQHGGMHARIAPFISLQDAGALLQRAGFALPVADSESLTVSYPHLYALMEDLRGAAQSNMLQNQPQHFTSRRFFTEAATEYAARHSDKEGRITATVELITITGWKPAPNQQQAARRGSGTISLRDALR